MTAERFQLLVEEWQKCIYIFIFPQAIQQVKGWVGYAWQLPTKLKVLAQAEIDIGEWNNYIFFLYLNSP